MLEWLKRAGTVVRERLQARSRAEGQEVVESKKEQAVAGIEGFPATSLTGKDLADFVVEKYVASDVTLKAEDLDAELKRLNDMLAAALECEDSMKDAIRKRIYEIESLRIQTDYPLLNLDFLKLRNPQSLLPKFAIFNPYSSKFKVYAGVNRWVEIFSGSEAGFSNWFKDMAKILEPIFCKTSDKRADLTAVFSGFIPEEIKLKLKEFTNKKNTVYFAAEVISWKVLGSCQPEIKNLILFTIRADMAYYIKTFEAIPIDKALGKKLQDSLE